MKKPLIAIVRHGHTKFNSVGSGSEQGRFRGWIDLPLDAQGIKDGKRVANEVRAFMPVDYIASSDLQRAYDTALMCARAVGVPYVQEARELRPWNVGDFAGQPVADLLDEIKRLAVQEDEAPPNGEPFKEFRLRYLPFLANEMKLAIAKNHCRIVVTHTRNIQLTKAWIANGLPEDYTFDSDVMNNYDKESGTGGIDLLKYDPDNGWSLDTSEADEGEGKGEVEEETGT